MPGNSPHDQSVTMRGPAAVRVNRAYEIGARRSHTRAGLERKLAHRTTIAPCSMNNIVDHPDRRITVNHMQRTNRSSRPRAHRYTIALFGVAMTTALCCGSAGARDRPVPAEARQACTPDAFRLCGAHIPDEDAVAACLKTNVQRLSVQCRQFISVRDAATGNGNPR